MLSQLGDRPALWGPPLRDPPQAEGSIPTSNSGELHDGKIHGIGCTEFLSAMDVQSPLTSQQSRGWDLHQFAGNVRSRPSPQYCNIDCDPSGPITRRMGRRPPASARASFLLDYDQCAIEILPRAVVRAPIESPRLEAMRNRYTRTEFFSV